MKKHLLKSIFISLILVTGVSSAWAATIFNCGIEVNETWYKGTGTINSGNWLGDQTAFNNKDFGVITSLMLGGQYDTWDNNQTDNCSWNASNGITITIKKGSTQKDQFKLSCYHSGKDGNNNVWKTTGTIGQCGDKSAYGRYTHNISQYAAGNDYTIAAKWFSPSGISTTGTAKFTIPGFTTTSNSQTFESTLVGNNNSKTISFGTHYGTTLKTNNCSISGTNYTEFSVTSINESGVTVQFKPTSAGSKTATLTITDAHSKKCTITLSGTAIATYTVTITNDGNGSTAPSGEQLNITEKDGIAISAEAAENFAFTSWTIVSGTGTFDAQNSVSTKFYPTSDATIQANFHSTITNSLSVVAGANVESVDGSTDPITLGESYEIKATPAYGYRFNQWKADPSENATFTDAASASTDVTVLNGSVTVTASATENMSTLTTSNNYDAGDPGYAVPSATVSKIGIATTAEITATATGNGYTFTGWTLDNCVRTDAGTADATTITVRSNGDGADVTVTANYVQNVVYFVNTKGWSTVKVYAWNDGGTKNAEWSGLALTADNVVKQIGGCDVYKYVPNDNYAKVIFNNGSEKTNDLTWENGKYYVYNSENSVGANDWYDESEVESVLPRYKTIYLNTGGSGLWDQDDAKFFVHVWGGSADGLDAQMTNLENEIYQVEVAASHAEIIFLRQSKETSGVVWNDQDGLYNKTDNLTIPADKNCYTITGWGGNEGKWSNLEYYVTGNKALVGGEGWKANEIKMAISNSEWSHTFEALEKGIEYQFKITRNGTWDKSWGYNALDPIVENTLECKDNNIGFILADKGNVTITFDGNNIELTTTSSFTAPVYTIVGDAAITGCHWDVNSVENQMVQDATDKNKFTLVKTVTATAGEYDYKAIRNYSYDWEVAPGEKLKIEKNGKGKITYTLDISTKKLTAEVSDWVEEVVAQEVTLVGIGENRTFTEADDHKTTSVAVELEANRVYTFEIIENSVYMKNNGTMWRGNCTNWTFKSEENNAHIVTDLAGTYTFTWTYEGNKLSVTYPNGTNVPAPVFLGGEMNEWSWINTRLIPSEDGKTASATVNLTEAKTYEFKIKQGDTHFGNNGTMTREYHEGFIFSEKKQDSEEAQVNAKIYADATGEYTFTWTYETNALTVDYPEIVTEPTPEVYTRTVTEGNYGTICLPYGSSQISGAEFYEVAGKEAGKVVLDQVTTLEAGMPYIFKATANELKVVYEGEIKEARNKNGLYGTLVNNVHVAEGNYIIFNNELRKCGTGCYVNENRAYLVLSEVPSSVPAQMPGRKRVGMAVTGENGTTDLDNLVAPNDKAIKVLHNGQIIIIRDGEKFNTLGQKL